MHPAPAPIAPASGPAAAPERADSGSRAATSPTAASFFEAETVEVAVEGVDVDLTVRHGDAAPMVPLGDLLPAVPQLLAVAGVENIEHGMGGEGHAPLYAEIETDVRIGLRRVLATAVREDHSVGD